MDRRLPGRLILPGLVDAHSHAFQRAFRGRVQWRAEAHDDFWSWRRAMYATALRLPPEGVEAVASLAFLEMAEAGITHVGEFHYLHHDPEGRPYADPDELAKRVVAAALRVGLRITLLRTAYARSGPGRPLGPEQRRFGDRDPDDVLAALERLGAIPDPRADVGLAPHSVRAVPADWLCALAAWGGAVHAHIAEQPAEVATCLDEHGCSPLEVFARAGLVGPRFTAVHLTHPSPGDVDRMLGTGGRVCVCPSTELDLGDGLLDLDARLRLPLCIGSDSHARVDPFGEARALELHGRAQSGRRNVLAPEGDRHGLARRLLDAATCEGSRALGREQGSGLRVGDPADLCVLDLDRPAAFGVPPLEAAVFSADPGWVDEVWVAGRSVVRSGTHPDRAAILAAATPWLEPS